MHPSSVRFFAAAMLLAAALQSCTCQRQSAIETLIPEGQPCTSDDKCETGLCEAVNGEEKKCLRTCTIGCRATELCTTLSENRLGCVQERVGLCKACTADSDCPQRADRCIMLGESGFCGRDCAQQECPDSYACTSATTVSGELVTKQCVPMSGTCSCVTASAGQQVGCSIENDAGTCLGVKVCTPPEGYSECNARTPGVETCNNIDDDCDGQTDEGITDLTCGVGACARTQAACLSGQTQSCTPGAPGMESCNGLDDDCDGLIDNPAFLATDPNNCGACGAVCNLANAIAGCSGAMCTIAQCVSNFGDCNTTAADGCEVNLGNDVNNCQTCGHVCQADNATSTCSSGHCAYTCDAAHWDINGLASDGCEYLCVKQNGGVEVCNGIDDDCDGTADEDFDTQTDVNNCGTCNTHCSALNGTPVCNSGMCGIGTCNQGFKNCDNVVANGCETNIFDDTDNCGLCGRVCNAAGGQTACSGGVCGISCNPGSADCNNSAADGCEKNIYTDLANCGGCGVACAPNHATGTCSAGDCRISTCDPGFADCNNNPSDGCEVNLNTDPTHCGACATSCNVNNGTATCNGGNCGINCATGFDNCDGQLSNGCEVNLTNDTSHCGTCATVCANTNGTATCSGSSCGIVCNLGYQNCNSNPADGCEVNVTNDPTHCGGCNTACSVANGAPVCNNSNCAVGICTPGFANCNMAYSDGCEVNTTNDTANCNACNAACTVANGSPVCTSSTCAIASCSGTFRNCDSMYGNGCETDTSNNVNNCGMCGFTCTLANAVNACTNSGCTIAACNAGYGNCDNATSNGCETNTNTSTAHCGVCGNACSLPNATPACNTGTCAIAACTGTFRNCDNTTSNGCEVNSANDVNNCSACGNACPNVTNATRTCSSSTCGFTCNNPYYNLDGNAANGCEYQCNVSSPGSTDAPDPNFLDNNCDGFDGIIAHSIFVATNGDDSGLGTKDSPFRTIQKGISVADAVSRPYVIISGGDYNEQLTLKNGVSLHGAYSRANNWQRGTGAGYDVRVFYGAVQTSPNRIVAVLGANITSPTTISRLTIEAVASTSAASPGVSVYGLYCSSCGGLTIDTATVIAGNGSPGTGGTGGTTGSSGNTGANGGGGDEDDQNVCGAGGSGASTNGSVGVCTNTAGGNGGGGGSETNSGGNGTASAAGVGGGAGGPGGQNGGSCGFACASHCGNSGDADGHVGGSGGGGAVGANASIGGVASITSGYFALTVGGTAGNGSPGQGGGGGGGGGGQGGTCVVDGCGNGGGGGGAGGCGGLPGTSGQPGGSSFGIFFISSSGAVVNNSLVRSGAGGQGGSGGSGGSGGNGGGPGIGGTVDGGPVGRGGNGGNGGAGGRGGHGAGGSGGWTYSIFRNNSTITTGGNTLQNGAAGLGGTSSGTAGTVGASGTDRAF